jgi:hypothetical protein
LPQCVCYFFSGGEASLHHAALSQLKKFLIGFHRAHLAMAGDEASCSFDARPTMISITPVLICVSLRQRGEGEGRNPVVVEAGGVVA